MKIVLIHFGRKGAGPAIALEMARALHKQGHAIYYYASSEVENRPYVEKEPFVSHFFDTYNSRLSYIKSVFLGNRICRVIKTIKSEQPDVVYSPMNDMWLPFIFPKLKGYLRIKTIHDVGIHEGNDSIINKWWNNTNFKDAEKFVILSQKYVPRLVGRGIKKENIVVIPHACFNYYVDLGKPSVKKTTGYNVLFFGRIDKYKGIDILLKAMSKVITAYPDVRLCIAGNGSIDNYAEAIDNCKNNVNLQNRWIKDEEVAGFVSWADIIVLPYIHATQSGVIPLAYAFSKPVVATNVGCLDEQVINGKTGFLVEGRNPDALADAMIKLLEEPVKAKAMGEYAHKYMQENLTWDASAKKLTEFIEKLR